MGNKHLTGFPSKDKPWLQYYKDLSMDITLPKCTLYENLLNTSKKYTDHIALEYFGKK